ncbi:MAG: tRNA uridine-5-carboxymethylaminomethyl(34) synthesis GTPase MnmE [Limnochordia bacterium]|jgi:tRNA modification GTPase
MLADTIAAIATGVGVAAVGVVRLSGPEAVDIADRLFRSRSGLSLKEAESHRMLYGTIVDPEGGILDQALVVVMRAPRSYTGEDIVEFHCHGSPVVLRAVLTAVIGSGARSADPGEFTKRAFVNGKLDLVQVEGVSDLLYARSERARKLAARQVEGALSESIESMRQTLIGFLAHVHASIDYPDEVAELTSQEWSQSLRGILQEIDRLLGEAQLGMRVREGIDTALVGRANVGKSSLMNALLRTPRAIVTPVAGTTRDVIEESCEIAGVAFRLSDTAGISDSPDPVEREGIRRTVQRVAEADLLLGVFDGSEALGDQDREVLRLLERHKSIVVLNKNDLPQRIDLEAFGGWRVVSVSAVTGSGLDALERAMVEAAQVGEPKESLLTRPRQVGALRATAQALRSVVSGAEEGITADCLAVDIEQALWHLGELTGETTPDEVINEIFSRFCVGK